MRLEWRGGRKGGECFQGRLVFKAQYFIPLNSRLESNKAEGEEGGPASSGEGTVFYCLYRESATSGVELGIVGTRLT